MVARRKGSSVVVSSVKEFRCSPVTARNRHPVYVRSQTYLSSRSCVLKLITGADPEFAGRGKPWRTRRAQAYNRSTIAGSMGSPRAERLLVGSADGRLPEAESLFSMFIQNSSQKLRT